MPKKEKQIGSDTRITPHRLIFIFFKGASCLLSTIALHT